MSRYCELKLIDVLKPEMSTNRSKTATDLKTRSTKNRCTKTKLGNFPLLKNKTDKLCDDTHTPGLGESRETRLTKKSSNHTKSNKLNQDTGVGDVGMIPGPKSEITTGKRKRIDNKTENVAENSTKKICNDRSSHAVSTRTISSNPDQKISQSRKRKKKSRESCWENKLTGAKRVSKRLSNLRIKKKKSLKNLGPSVDASHVLIKSKQPVTFSGRGKIKTNEDVYKKSGKMIKTSYKKHRQEVQINFGKLSHTMRLYPKIAASRNRRPSTYTVTIKPTGSIHRNSGNRICNEHFTEEITDEESSDLDISSLISKCEEDVQDEIVSETEKIQVSSPYKIEDNEKHESNNETHPNETTEDNGFEAITQENDVQTSFCSSTEEFADGSTIVIVDIESGESFECQSEENQGNEQNTESEERSQEEKQAENLTNHEKLSEAPEVINVINFNPTKSNEKGKNDNSNSSNTNMIETNSKSEPEGKEKPIISESSNESLTVEVVDIANPKVEVEK